MNSFDNSQEILSEFDKKHLEVIWGEIDWEYMQEMNDTGEVVEEIAISDKELALITTRCTLEKIYQEAADEKQAFEDKLDIVIAKLEKARKKKY